MFPFDIEMGERVTVTVSLKTRDNVLRSDFSRLLAKLREVYPQPPKPVPLPPEWIQNNVLQVWDLRQYEVPWHELVDELFSKDRRRKKYKDPLKLPRNAHDTAKSLIDNEGWLILNDSIRKKKRTAGEKLSGDERGS